jgi:hypothetical protein
MKYEDRAVAVVLHKAVVKVCESKELQNEAILLHSF